ncbi:hypothetical protein WJX81_004529 [Elliptochloris bilobata]|uniref:Vacuolar protein 14 C-terminal Fig4-binding domain-containing protein n=1 Tax=Elliptochloris bilobata TaxID=381761 RepID=A0AAW1SCY0_9CHLO
MPAGSVDGEALLTQQVLRGLGDKLYDKRKLAALEVEQLVKNLAREGYWRAVVQILDRLTRDYAYSPQANCRKGGLLALAAAAVALAERKQDAKKRGEAWPGPDYLASVVPPVLNALVDGDARVRYYACEALYNIAKVAREDFLEPHFTDTFDALFRLVADPDPAVHQATTFLDALMKDIVTAHEHFNMEKFVQQFQEALKVTAPRKRAFLLSWMQVLASVPDLDMLAHLPRFLERMLDCLRDPMCEVRVQAAKVLQDLLLEVQTSAGDVDVGSLTVVLATAAHSDDDTIRLTALRWLRTFVLDARAALLPRYALVLSAVLPALAAGPPDIVQLARETNAELLALPEGWEACDPAALLAAVAAELGSVHEPTRLAALLWLHTLLGRSRQTVLDHLGVLLPALFDALSAPSERVAVEALAVLGALAADDEGQFRSLMQELLDRFRGPLGARLLQRRGGLIVRRLAARLGGRAVFGGLSAILEGERDLPFAAALVQALNLILLTSPELRDLRALLQRAGAGGEGAALFSALYRSWCHSVGAVLSLCFLAQAYDHAYDLAASFADLGMNVEVLVQVDRLVQLLETPVFTPLRLQLLHPAHHPALLRALYALLMLLPQSDAFKTLHARLHSVPPMALLHPNPDPDPAVEPHRISRATHGLAAPDISAAMADGIGATPSSNGGARDRGGEASGSGGPGSDERIDFGPLLALFRARQQAHADDEEARRSSANDANVISAEHEDVMARAAWDSVEGLQGKRPLSGLTADRRTVSDESSFPRMYTG